MKNIDLSWQWKKSIKIITIFWLSLNADGLWNPDLKGFWMFWLNVAELWANIAFGLKGLVLYVSCWNQNDGKPSVFSLNGLSTVYMVFNSILSYN